MNNKEIRGIFDKETITVYQAYSPEIAIPAVKNQKFVPPFKMERMTWIKPSFLWMMYRCGWAQKKGQEHVLAIKIKREGWEWALKNACLSHYDTSIHKSHEAWKESVQNSPVRIQWDPERDINLKKLEYRAIQVGLSGEAVSLYVNEWMTEISDITDYCKAIHQLILNGKMEEAIESLPHEGIY
ncbi:DUF4291 domain-containing protein [Flammeovirga pectinis]|uniref:DUF4291 domain-containing protein n=1 Tax=Flammeovirga pectinis TaxID=2494373 RepID=A0A3S9PAM4_9BACT|nr:DUF4291 domain-containing protein [Flammeovirga pectinis]AZQ65233.1 DUF4291 domain-containing protein [Flammeovirga pectinis]AZQ65238.1 DUF4291 domain-containing protein [Flammeovirga pectinis]